MTLLGSSLAALLAGLVVVRTGPVGAAAGLLLLTGVEVGSGWARLLPGLFLAGASSGVLNAALARQAVASMPSGLASLGSGTNNPARYLGAAVGVTVVAVLAAHPDAPSVVAGWHVAAFFTAGVLVLGAVAVALPLRRRTASSAPSASSASSGSGAAPAVER